MGQFMAYMDMIISIHAPAKGATRREVCYTLFRRNFNPRSREGSDHYFRRQFFRYADFNPRSREGSDVEIFENIAKEGRFQSTLPRRERLKMIADSEKRVDISIHAPAKGATKTAPQNKLIWNNFNPRSREGSDNNISTAFLNFFLFQSTLPRRERRKRRWTIMPSWRFQSTLPRRERLMYRFLGEDVNYFNPRSREGSDWYCYG